MTTSWSFTTRYSCCSFFSTSPPPPLTPLALLALSVFTGRFLTDLAALDFLVLLLFISISLSSPCQVSSNPLRCSIQSVLFRIDASQRFAALDAQPQRVRILEEAMLDAKWSRNETCCVGAGPERV